VGGGKGFREVSTIAVEDGCPEDSCRYITIGLSNLPESRPMQEILKAVYENGIFRPLEVPQLAEGQIVKLIVQSQGAIAPDDMLALAASVYEGLSEDEINEVEQTMSDRTNFC